MKHGFILTVAFLSLLGVAQAQITYTRADFDAFLTSPVTTTYDADNAEATIFAIGAPGAGVNVNFDQFSYTSYSTPQVYVNPATTPYAAEFPTATHASVGSMQGEEAYVYIRAAQDGIYMLGMATVIQGTPMILKYTPDYPTIKFPLTRGVSWNYSSDPMSPFMGITMQTRTVNTADASGTFTFGGKSYEYLRVKSVEYSTQKIEFGGTVLSEDVSRTVGYQYLTKDGLMANVQVDTNYIDDPNPMLLGVSMTAAAGVVSAEKIPIADEGFALIGQYPSPVVSSGSTITWRTAAPANVTIDVYDLTGRRLASVWQGAAQPGTHQSRLDASTLTSGSYILRASNGSATRQSMFTVVR